MCVTTALSVRLTSGAVLLSDLQASFIYENTNEISLHTSVHVITINEKTSHDFEREKEEMYGKF